MFLAEVLSTRPEGAEASTRPEGVKSGQGQNGSFSFRGAMSYI